MMPQLLQQITLTDVPLKSLRDKLRAFARLFDVSVFNVSVEVQGDFETRDGEPVFLGHTFQEVTLFRDGNLPRSVYAHLDGDSEWTAIKPEHGVIRHVRLSLYA